MEDGSPLYGCCHVIDVSCGELPGLPEIAEKGISDFVNQNILWFYISVNDA